MLWIKFIARHSSQACRLIITFSKSCKLKGLNPAGLILWPFPEVPSTEVGLTQKKKQSIVTEEKMCFLGNHIAPPIQTLTSKKAALK